MRNKTISLPEEIFEKLKKESNASALISNLLEDYFEKSKQSNNQIIDDVKNKIAKNDEEEKSKEKWILEFRSKFKTKEEMLEFVKGASENLKAKFSWATGQNEKIN